MLFHPRATSSIAHASSVAHSYAGISAFVRLHWNPKLTKLAQPKRSDWRCRSFSAGPLRSRDDSTQRGFLENYKKTYEFPEKTHELDDLPSEENAVVTLHGYVGTRADVSKKLSFVQLLNKDLKCSLQIKSTLQDSIGHERIKSIRAHSPVAVRGRLTPRPAPRKPDGGSVKKINHVELELDEVFLLNEFPEDIIMKEDTNFPSEKRHLQIRNDKAIRDALAFRSTVTGLCRDQLGRQGFIEVETPLLFKSTPEGAREFLVPTRAKGLAYALPQSPQQYKQMLMGSGIPKYFQIARCFRDEDLRADRQPEFTQLDLEMSFARGRDVMMCMEALLKRLWKDLLDKDLPASFPQLTYHEVMSRYGSDKPDVRLGMEIRRLEHLLPVDLIRKIGPLNDPIVDALRLRVSDNPKETRDFISRFMESPEATPFHQNLSGQPGIFIYDSGKPLCGLQPLGFEAAEQTEEIFDLEHGDALILQARDRVPLSGGSTVMGDLRLALHRAAVAAGLKDPPSGFEFLWVTDFPLFMPSGDDEPGQGGTAGFASTHHPFTAPLTTADVDLLAKDPAAARADHYDIVVNGVELGGGSRRIHDARVQEYVLRDVLGMPQERLNDFRHLLEMLRAGCPPHAGIALGLDRLLVVMLGKESVRDVIAFPKSGRGEDVLVGAPSCLTEEQLHTYHLQLVES